ncbi:hypothetical protein BC943DRAFT_7553 [Umbelopsis sp. AD052]|nr:hypothetical protein BC943DRAFT_7553 [Umbelopsis sp. AD052]
MTHMFCMLVVLPSSSRGHTFRRFVSRRKRRRIRVHTIGVSKRRVISNREAVYKTNEYSTVGASGKLDTSNRVAKLHSRTDQRVEFTF